VLIAAALGLRIRTLVSIMSPVREDLWIRRFDGTRIEVLPEARKNIDFWMHLHTDGSDRWQKCGVIGDGRFDMKTVRAHPWAVREGAGMNYFIENVGHSRMLQE